MSPRRAASTGSISLLALLLAAPLLAQGTGGAASLNGVVVDTQGGFIPGATIEIRNTATGVTETLVSNANGAFSMPALSPGLYTVTASLNGFKTSVLSEVRLVAATPAQIKTVLEVGALTETVEVKGGAELVQTTIARVQSTMLAEQIHEAAARLAQRALNFGRCSCPASSTTGEPPRLDDQRPAAEHDQHHDRRRQHRTTTSSRPTASSRW